MKTSFIASIIGAAVLVAAQTPDLSQLPSCALPCATSSMSVPGCGATDFTCICKNEKFISDVSTCLKSACTDPADLAKAITVAQALCGSNLPSGAVSSLTGSPTGTPTGNATTGSGSSGNSTNNGGSGSTPTKSGGNASSTSNSNSAAGLVPGGFAVAAIFAGLLTL